MEPNKPGGSKTLSVRVYWSLVTFGSHSGVGSDVNKQGSRIQLPYIRVGVSQSSVLQSAGTRRACTLLMYTSNVNKASNLKKNNISNNVQDTTNKFVMLLQPQDADCGHMFAGFVSINVCIIRQSAELLSRLGDDRDESGKKTFCHFGCCLLEDSPTPNWSISSVSSSWTVCSVPSENEPDTCTRPALGSLKCHGPTCCIHSECIY